MFLAHNDCHMNYMHTRSDPVERADQDARRSQERSPKAPGPPARHLDQAAAAAEFERLRARLRQLAGTDSNKR